MVYSFTYFLNFFYRKAEEESEKENKKDLSTEAELLAAKQREILPVEERIQMFRLMLIEKEVKKNKIK